MTPLGMTRKGRKRLAHVSGWRANGYFGSAWMEPRDLRRNRKRLADVLPPIAPPELIVGSGVAFRLYKPRWNGKSALYDAFTKEPTP